MKNLFLYTSFITIISVSCDTPDSAMKSIALRDTLSYVVNMQGNEAGTHKVWQDTDMRIRANYEFNDRGRGPELESTIQLDENGNISSLVTQGKSYMKGTVDEQFMIVNDTASWTNVVEQYSDVPYRDQFYVSYHNVPFEWSLMLRAMVNSRGSMEVLPGGTLNATELTSTSIDGFGKVSLYSIQGLDFVPSYLWVDDQLLLFASMSGWLYVIRDEFKDQAPVLSEIQKEYEDRFYTDLASQLTTVTDDLVILKDANVFEPSVGEILEDMSVVLSGNKIIETGSFDELINKAGEVIDLSGKTLMPGLWDMHVHIQDLDGLLHIAAGITSARDMANNPWELPDRVKEFDSNYKIGPRVMRAAFIDGTGPFQGPISREFLASNLEEGLAVIERYDSIGGYEQIKLYSSITPEWVRPMAARAHELGLRVSGHIPAYMTAEQAVSAGYDEIQHINMLFLNFLGDTLDTRSPVRFTAVAEYGALIDFNSSEFRGFMDQLRSKDIVVDPTVSIFEGMFTSKPREVDPAFEAIINRLPVNVRRGQMEGGLEVDSEEERNRNKLVFDKALRMIGELHRSGIKLVAGTDNLAGFTLHRELENYYRAGIPNEKILRLATLGSAEVMGRADSIGSVKPGYLADLVVIDGDPVEDISNIRRVELVIKDGKRYDPKAVYAALGVKHFK